MFYKIYIKHFVTSFIRVRKNGHTNRMQSAIDVENLKNEIRCLSADGADSSDRLKGNQWEATS